MERKRRKWGLWFLTAIASLCLLVAGIFAVPSYETVAEDTLQEYTVTSIRADRDVSATTLYIVDENGDGGTWGEGNWDDVYALERGTGAGLSLNGVALETKDIKQPGSLYIGLGVTAKSGDVFVIDGSYYSAEMNKRITFENCALSFDGTTWSTWTGTFSGDVSLGTSATSNATYLYLKTENALRNANSLSLSAGQGILVNNQTASNTSVRISNGEFRVTLRNIKANDVVSISGVFKNNSSSYVIKECRFLWDGSAWSDYSTISQVVTNLTLTHPTANGFYLSLSKNLQIEDWDNAFELVSGAGITLNGVSLTRAKIKPVLKTVYVDLGTTATAGDILAFEGTYYFSATPELELVFENTNVLQYDGSAWTVVNNTYALGMMDIAAPSAQASSALNTQIYLNSSVTLPVQNWDDVFAVAEGSKGLGVTVNGVAVDFVMKSTDVGLFLEFGAVQVGDVLSVGGVFYCDANGYQYAIAEKNFKWNGTTWEVGKPYVLSTVTNVTAMTGSDAFYLQLGLNLGFSTWDYAYTVWDGGISINGKTLANATMKPLDSQVYVELRETVNKGDLLTFEGSYYCETDAVASKLVFAQPIVLQYDGSKWSALAAYSLGTLSVKGPSNVTGANNAIYLASSVELRVKDWDNAFNKDGGVGLTINGEAATLNTFKSTSEGIYLDFAAVKVNDVLAISGTFVYSLDASIRYYVEESKFVWNGECWENYGAYNTYTIALQANNDSAASYLYLVPQEGSFPFHGNGDWGYKLAMRSNSGKGVTLNGNAIALDMAIPKSIYLGLGVEAKVGDILVVDGIFYNNALNVKYIFDARFVWNGSRWLNSPVYEDSELAFYDDVTIDDLGWDPVQNFNGSAYDYSGSSYTKSAENTTGSVKFRFGYNSADVASGELSIRLRTTDGWNGVFFKIAQRDCIAVDGDVDNKFVALADNTHYEIEVGAINLLNSSAVWVYIKVDGTVLYSEVRELDPVYSTNKISLYIAGTAETTVVDPDYVVVDVETSNGVVTEYVKENTEYVLPKNTTDSAFVGWDIDGVLYQAGQTISLAESNLILKPVALNFVLEDGAAIRLASTADNSGIRFTANVSEESWTKLLSYNASVKEQGVLIMPYDYLTAGQAPNLEDFVAGSTVLKIVCAYTETVEGVVIYRGAMKNLYEKNYGRDFAGRGYMIITLENGAELTIYTPFDVENNVRSVKTVALRLQEDTDEYDALREDLKKVVDAYAASSAYTPNSVNSVVSQIEEGCAAAYVINEKNAQAIFAGQRKETV